MARSGARHKGFLALLALAVALGGTGAPVLHAAEGKSRKSDKAAKLSAADIMKAGDEAARGGDPGRAMNFYMQAIELEPSADLWFRVGWVYQGLEKKAEAAQAYTRAIEMAPEHATSYEALGLLLLEGKSRPQAAALLQRAVELDAQRWRAHNALGALADADGNYAQARSHYEAALAIRPGMPMLLNNLGYSHYLAGNFAEAAEHYRKALEGEPGNRAAKANLGLLYARQKQYNEALEVLAAAMDRAKAHNDVGYVAFQNGDLAVAERLLEEAIRLSPSYYATAHENLKRVREAMAGDAAGAPPPERSAAAARPRAKAAP